MTFNGKQLAALVKMGVTMAAVDGKIADEEQNAMVSDESAIFVSSANACTQR